MFRRLSSLGVAHSSLKGEHPNVVYHSLKASGFGYTPSRLKSHLMLYWPFYVYFPWLLTGMVVFYVLENSFQPTFDSRATNLIICVNQHGVTGYIAFVISATTTVGFGTLYPCCIASRIFCIFYCLVGIPITLVILTRFGDFVCKLVTKVHKALPPKTEDPAQEEEVHVPISIGVMLILISVSLAALYYRLIEHYNAAESIYYGFYTFIMGDLQLRDLNYAFVMFLLVLFGFSMVATTFDIVQSNIEKLGRKVEKEIQRHQLAIINGEIELQDGDADEVLKDILNKHGPFLRHMMTGNQMKNLQLKSDEATEQTKQVLGNNSMGIQVGGHQRFVNSAMQSLNVESQHQSTNTSNSKLSLETFLVADIRPVELCDVQTASDDLEQILPVERNEVQTALDNIVPITHVELCDNITDTSDLCQPSTSAHKYLDTAELLPSSVSVEVQTTSFLPSSVSVDTADLPNPVVSVDSQTEGVKAPALLLHPQANTSIDPPIYVDRYIGTNGLMMPIELLLQHQPITSIDSPIMVDCWSKTDDLNVSKEDKSTGMTVRPLSRQKLDPVVFQFAEPSKTSVASETTATHRSSKGCQMCRNTKVATTSTIPIKLSRHKQEAVNIFHSLDTTDAETNTTDLTAKPMARSMSQRSHLSSPSRLSSVLSRQDSRSPDFNPTKKYSEAGKPRWKL